MREATLAERIARSRRAVQKAKLVLANHKNKSPEAAARYARSRAATAKARALLNCAPDRTRRDRAENTWRGEDLALTWRGKTIRISKWMWDMDE